jgi:hypothetical protein
MIKTVGFLGIATGIALIAIALIGTQPSASVEAREDRPQIEGCPLQEVALDEGYGVSRMVMRSICAE